MFVMMVADTSNLLGVEMGKVFEFPSQQAQGLTYLDRELRCLLESKGADQALIDFAAKQLTRIYAELSDSEQYIFSLKIPAEVL